jgi:hypothetical protein
MKKCVTIPVAAVLAVWTASAQEGQKVGAYIGYDYVRFNSATGAASFSANGGNGQFLYKFNNTIGAVADLGAVHNNNLNGIHADTSIANFLLGPAESKSPVCASTIFSGALGRRVRDE